MDTYLCPRCGSKGSEPHIIGIGPLDMRRCKDCGFIGPFYVVDAEDAEQIQKKMRANS